MIILTPLLHRGSENIAIGIEKNSEFNNLAKKIKGVKWSQTNRCWYLPLCKENYERIEAALGSIASINKTALQVWLKKKKEVKDSLAPTTKNKSHTAIIKNIAFKLSTENLEALTLFVQHLKLHAYSPSTIQTYRNEFMQLLQRLKEQPVKNVTPEELRDYMHYIISEEQVSENTAHSRLNALKYYFEQVLRKEKFFYDIPRPKKTQQLPKIFSKQDITAIINSVQNLKHKTMLMLAYSAGLRVSEVVNLKPTR